MAPSQADPCLYLVTPPGCDIGNLEAGAAELSARHVACFQLWMPSATDDVLLEAARRLAPTVQARDIAFILNGDAQIAASAGCDGVHLDAADPGAIKRARKLLGQDGIIGVSCGASRHDAMLAAEAGADYVSFGPIYRTETKDRNADPAAMETLIWWAEMMEVPCVAVGGITPDNAGPALRAGADFLAVVSAAWDHPDGLAAGTASFADAAGA